jgi:hypothetical protein
VSGATRANHWIIAFPPNLWAGERAADTTLQFYINAKGQIVENSTKGDLIAAGPWQYAMAAPARVVPLMNVSVITRVNSQ